MINKSVFNFFAFTDNIFVVKCSKFEHYVR